MAIKKKTPKSRPASKAEIVATLSEHAEVPRKVAEGFLETLEALIVGELRADRPFVFPGLGKFSLKRFKARVGSHPQTGKKLKIPAKTKVRFVVGKSLQDRVMA